MSRCTTQWVLDSAPLGTFGLTRRIHDSVQPSQPIKCSSSRGCNHCKTASEHALAEKAVFVASTPLDSGDLLMRDGFPWLTLVHKSLIFFSVWESLGLGVLHGPLHGKMAPPFQDWWYRLTPGTLKYNAPFMRWAGLSGRRGVLDVLVEGVLYYIFALRALSAPHVSPELMFPLMSCCLYEFVFDFGQHLSTYGTQNLHLFMCCCFPVGSGQVAGMQLFLNWFYFVSGFCKLGPTFPYLFTSNLMTCKYMVDKPWSAWFRRTFFKAYKDEDYGLTGIAIGVATLAALIEMTVPLLTWLNDPIPVYFSIVVFVCMHIFIISTLVVDVYSWNFSDAIWYVVLYGVIGTGVDWHDAARMSPWLAGWLVLHGAYVVYGNLFPDQVPYVVAHRHAAGNWSQGVLVVKKSAAQKLGKLKAHAGMPGLQPGWAGEWFGFQAFWSYTWNWNVPSKMLVPLVLDAMGKDGPTDGQFHSTGEYVLLHSVLFLDALLGNVRFDGLSSLDTLPEIAKVCGFEESECRLCWAGPFASFFLWMCSTPKATWKIVDAATGVIKEGKYTIADVTDPHWRKPSDVGRTRLLPLVAGFECR
eukprot:TRINITY_DN27717_c0_g1_i1.p1 TRINITY_DN27717_c0_g1~~TRINITY_DN27717_c0_g1_i1.p1  ORF type:complete len:583 (-),score=94.31 TRINITY_DN27717_c0_g1_i1:71-1819(-)